MRFLEDRFPVSTSVNVFMSTVLWNTSPVDSLNVTFVDLEPINKKF